MAVVGAYKESKSRLALFYFLLKQGIIVLEVRSGGHCKEPWAMDRQEVLGLDELKACSIICK
jgi:hypothetical protein